MTDNTFKNTETNMLLSKCACKDENFSTKDDLFKKNIIGKTDS